MQMLYASKYVNSESPFPTPRENALMAVAYMWLGVGMLIYWNVMLNSVYLIQTVMFPGDTFLPATCTIVFDAVSFTFMCILTFLVRSPRIMWAIHVGVVTAVISCSLWMVGAKTESYWCLLAASGLGGLSTALMQAPGFAYASCYPVVYSGWVSFGNGLSGLLTLGVWLLAKILLWPEDSATHALLCQQLLVAIAVVAALVVSAFMWAVVRLRVVKLWNDNTTPPDAKPVMYESTEPSSAGGGLPEKLMCPATPYELELPNSNAENADSQSRSVKLAVRTDLKTQSTEASWKHILRRSWDWQLHLCWTCYVTMIIFPNVGPFNWKESTVQATISIGILQVGDALGRLMPNFGDRMSPQNLKALNLSRGALVIAAILIKTNETLKALFWTHILILTLLGVSNGYCATLELVYLPEAFSDKESRGKSAALATTVMVGSICAGLASSYALLHII